MSPLIVRTVSVADTTALYVCLCCHNFLFAFQNLNKVLEK